MDAKEYQLTEDELGMLEEIQAETNKVITDLTGRANSLLISIIKYRKLPEGRWNREGNMLKRIM